MAQVTESWATDPLFRTWLDSLQLPVQALMLVQGFNGLRLTIIFRLTNIYWIGDAKEGYPRIDRIGPRGFDRYMYNIWGGFVLAAAIPKKRMRPMLVRDPRGRSFCSLVRSHIPSGTLAPVTHFVRHAWETSAVTDSIPST